MEAVQAVDKAKADKCANDAEIVDVKQKLAAAEQECASMQAKTVTMDPATRVMEGLVDMAQTNHGLPVHMQTMFNQM